MAKRKVINLPSDAAEKMNEIGIKVAEHRQAVGSNYKKFAEANNFSSMTLWRIENGEDYKMSSFLQVLKAIGITPEDFFSKTK